MRANGASGPGRRLSPKDGGGSKLGPGAHAMRANGRPVTTPVRSGARSLRQQDSTNQCQDGQGKRVSSDGRSKGRLKSIATQTDMQIVVGPNWTPATGSTSPPSAGSVSLEPSLWPSMPTPLVQDTIAAWQGRNLRSPPSKPASPLRAMRCEASVSPAFPETGEESPGSIPFGGVLSSPEGELRDRTASSISNLYQDSLDGEKIGKAHTTPPQQYSQAKLFGISLTDGSAEDDEEMMYAQLRAAQDCADQLAAILTAHDDSLGEDLRKARKGFVSLRTALDRACSVFKDDGQRRQVQPDGCPNGDTPKTNENSPAIRSVATSDHGVWVDLYNAVSVSSGNIVRQASPITSSPCALTQSYKQVSAQPCNISQQMDRLRQSAPTVPPIWSPWTPSSSPPVPPVRQISPGPMVDRSNLCQAVVPPSLLRSSTSLPALLPSEMVLTPGMNTTRRASGQFVKRRHYRMQWVLEREESFEVHQ